METQVITKASGRYLAGVRGKRLIEKDSDVSDLIGVCYEKDAFVVLLYKENLPDGFTKLQTGQAGMVINKFITNKIKLAVVVDEADLDKGKFAEMVTEVNRYNSLFHVFADASLAEEWLLRE